MNSKTSKINSQCVVHDLPDSFRSRGYTQISDVDDNYRITDYDPKVAVRTVMVVVGTVPDKDGSHGTPVPIARLSQFFAELPKC